MYFRLCPDVWLVRGVGGGMLYDVGNRRLRRLSREQSAVLSRCEGTVSLEELAAEGPCDVSALLADLVRARFGHCYPHPVAVDRYVCRTEKPLTARQGSLRLRVAYLQVGSFPPWPSSAADRHVPAWQGCNGQELWPDVGDGLVWSDECAGRVLDDLEALGAKNIVIFGGSSDEAWPVASRTIAEARRRLPSAALVVTVVDGTIVEPRLKQLPLERTTINLILPGGGRALSTGSGETPTWLAEASSQCRARGVRFVITLVAPSRRQEIVHARALGSQLGAARVVLSEPIRLSPEDRVLPLLSVATTGPERALPIGPQEMMVRRRDNACLAGTIAVTAGGVIRPCPMIAEPLGTVDTGGLRAVFRERRHLPFWSWTKEQVASCRSCESRYACVDCAAIDRLRVTRPTVGSSLCRYDPRTGRWAPPSPDEVASVAP